MLQGNGKFLKIFGKRGSSGALIQTPDQKPAEYPRKKPLRSFPAAASALP